MFGEFDGEDKYWDVDLWIVVIVIDVVMVEKYCEDEICGVMGWCVVCWGF